MAPTAPTRFAFSFERTYALPARLFGITPDSASVTIEDGQLRARFGPWSVATPVTNVVDHTVTGPYALARTIGPAHVSLADRGLTFATNRRRGLCLTFKEPVTGLDPLGVVRHPGLTVTVVDSEGLAAAIDAARAEAAASDVDVRTSGATAGSSAAADRPEPDELEQARVEQAAEDDLHTMTASQLRGLADDRGLRHTARMKRADLVDLLEADLGDDLVEVVEELDLER